MLIKIGRFGKFLACSAYPDCKNAKPLNGNGLNGNGEPASLGQDPDTGLEVLTKVGRFGPYVQLGENGKKEKGKKEKLRRSSIPRDKDPKSVTLNEALKYLSLPRELGQHPDTKEIISANIGRFGPYIVHQKDFRSLKKDDVYKIELPRALEILAEEKKKRFAKRKKKE